MFKFLIPTVLRRFFCPALVSASMLILRQLGYWDAHLHSWIESWESVVFLPFSVLGRLVVVGVVVVVPLAVVALWWRHRRG